MFKVNFSIFILLAGVVLLLSPRTSAQDPSSKPYKRLIETQHDYDAAVVKGDSGEIAEMSYRMGKRYMGLNNFFKAQQWFQRSLAIRRKQGPSEDLGKLYARMAECGTYDDHYKQVVKYSMMAFDNFSKAKSEIGLLTGYHLMAGIHEIVWKVGNKEAGLTHFKASLDSAVFYHQKALRIAEKLNLPKDVALAHEMTARTWFLKNEWDKGENDFEKARAIYAKDSLWQNIIGIDCHAALLLLNAHQDKRAKPWLVRAQEMNRRIKDVNTSAERSYLDSAMSIYYQRNGSWDKAFAYQQKYHHIKTQEKDAFRTGAMEGITAVYENEKNQLIIRHHRDELALMHKNEKRQMILLSAILLLCIVSVLVGFFYFHLFKKFKNLSNENEGLVREQSHRIKNNLQSVADLLGLHLMRLSDPATIKVIEESLFRVDTISLIHRRLYSGEFMDLVEVKKFIPDLVNNVVRNHHDSPIQTHFHTEDFLLNADQVIPLGLIINELATNSCKYAFGKTANAAPSIRISCHIENGKVVFEYSDNGPGFLPDPRKDTFGVRIIALMTKKLKGKERFEVHNGSHFTLIFDIAKQSRYYSAHIPKPLKHEHLN